MRSWSLSGLSAFAMLFIHGCAPNPQFVSGLIGGGDLFSNTQWAAWSQDGSKLYVCRKDDVYDHSPFPLVIPFESGMGPDRRKFVLDIVDPAKQSIVSRPLACDGRLGFDYPTGWPNAISPDERRYLSAERRVITGRRGGMTHTAQKWDSISVLDLNTGEAWHTPKGQNVADAGWSPDGQWVIYRTAEGMLYKSQADGSTTDSPIQLDVSAPEAAWLKPNNLSKLLEYASSDAADASLVVKNHHGDVVRLIDVKRWQLGTPSYPKLWFRNAASQPCGPYLSASEEGNATKLPRRNLTVYSCFVDPSASYIVGRQGWEYVIVDLATGQGKFTASALRN